MSHGCRIIRDQTTKLATLHVAQPGDWKLYAGTAQDNIDFSKPILRGETAGEFTIQDSPQGTPEHTIFALECTAGTAYLAERRLPMSGGFNFRDLGGFAGAGGKRIVWGKLFRSDDLKSLTPEDLQYLNSIPLSRVVDFRTTKEVQRVPDRLPPSVSQYMPLPIVPGTIRGEDASLGTSAADELMVGVYRLFITDPDITQMFKQFFHHVQDEAASPLLYHCAAGKDRTGFATAMILYSLGVPEETIMKDYLSSAQYLTGKYPTNAGIFGVQPRFLEAALQQIHDSHGSVNTYLTTVLEVSPEKMQALYLR